MIFIERLSELLRGLLPGRNACLSNKHNTTPMPDAKDESSTKSNPWTHSLDRLAYHSRPETPDHDRTESGEIKIQLLMEQARLEKAKEMLKQQQQGLRLGELEPAPGSGQNGDRRRPRNTDATIVDTKAWWGQAVATWNPDDAKNLGPQGEIKHPRQHKWFNQ